MADRETRARLHVGGQAVIEGVMMRSPTCIATAVRDPEGKIIIKSEGFMSLTKRHRLLNLPIVRGAIVLIETFVIAVRSLSFSAGVAAEDRKHLSDRAKGAAAETRADAGTEDAKKSTDPSGLYIALTIIGAFAIGFTVFFYLPLVLTEWTGLESGLLFNLVDGLIRFVFIFLYIYLLTRWKEMQRIFEYHGAEHKTIYAFEEEGEFDVDAVRSYPRVHPRCSTSFLLLVVLVSILLFIMLGRPENISDRLVRFSFIPLIGGVSYELLRISSRNTVKRYFGFIFWPGLFLQRLTTREPSPDQIEVAIAALHACLGSQQEP